MASTPFKLAYRPLLVMLGLAIAACSMTHAEDLSWESLSGGVVGQPAIFKGAGGVTIAGYIRKPAGTGPFPIVILLHGGAPAAKAVAGEDEATKAKAISEEALRASRQMGRANHPPIPELLAQGWAVYSIDYRTNPRYTLDPLEWDDTTIAVEKAKAFAFVDRSRVAMIGGSHGGHVTARMSSRVKLSCAVLFAPAGLDLVSLGHLAEQGISIGGNQRLIRELEQRSGAKLSEIEQSPDTYRYSSPLNEISKVQCPILMISGRNDPSAPLAVMDQYVKALQNQGTDASAWHPDNGPHGFYFGMPKVIPETAESTVRAVAFVKEHFDPSK